MTPPPLAQSGLNPFLLEGHTRGLLSGCGHGCVAVTSAETTMPARISADTGPPTKFDWTCCANLGSGTELLN